MANTLPPAPISTTDLNSYQWKDWFRKLQVYVTGVSSLLWSTIDFSGSSITDIADRQHNDLQVLQGGLSGDYYHLSSIDYIGNGIGALVRTTSPTLVTPILGTPTSGVLTNCTGTAAGLTAGNATTAASCSGNAATVTTNANLTGHVTSVGNAAVLGSFTMAQLDTAVNDGNVVFQGAALGTPSSGTLTNCTFPSTVTNSSISISSGGVLSGAGGGTVTAAGLGVPTGSGTCSGTNTGDQTSIVGISGTMAQFDTAVTDGNIVYQSQALGTPTSGDLTNCTNVPLNSITGLASGISTFLGTANSANLRTAVTDETGTGALVFADTPTLVTPVLGAATATSVASGTLKATSAAGYISSDGSTGYTGTVTSASLVGKTITIKDGIITGFA